jgi:hypothetical protein
MSHNPSLRPTSSHFVLLVDCRNNHMLDGVICPCPSRQFADPQRQSHQWRYSGRHSPLRICGPHSPDGCPAWGASQHHTPHPDYTRPTSHLLITSIGTGPAHYRQKRFQRFESSWSSALRMVPKKDTGWRPNHFRLLSHMSHAWLLPPAFWLFLLLQDRSTINNQHGDRKDNTIILTNGHWQ